MIPGPVSLDSRNDERNAALETKQGTVSLVVDQIELTECRVINCAALRHHSLGSATLLGVLLDISGIQGGESAARAFEDCPGMLRTASAAVTNSQQSHIHSPPKVALRLTTAVSPSVASNSSSTSC